VEVVVVVEEPDSQVEEVVDHAQEVGGGGGELHVQAAKVVELLVQASRVEEEVEV
jgi:hypothetical protein